MDYSAHETKQPPLPPPLPPPSRSRSRYGSFTSPLPAYDVDTLCATRPSSSFGRTSALSSSLGPALAPSSSPPLLPAHLVPFSYQRGAAMFSPPPPADDLTSNPAVNPSSHQQGSSQAAFTTSAGGDAASLAPPIDVLAPPLDTALQSKVYSFTKLDYLSHLNDLLRLRVLAAIMFLLAILVWHYFAQNNWSTTHAAVGREKSRMAPGPFSLFVPVFVCVSLGL